MRPYYAKMVGGLILATAAVAVGAPATHAQGYGSPGGGPVYVPFAGPGGSFIPYSPGPAGGFGVQPGTLRPMGRVSPPTLGAPTMAEGLGMRRELGGLGTLLPPLPTPKPMGMGAGGGLIRRPSGGGMSGATARPPVGGYPFRPPTSFGISAAPPMGM